MKIIFEIYDSCVLERQKASHENRDQISKGDDLDLMGWFDGIISVQMFYYGIIEINRGVQNIRRENEQEGDFSSKLYEKEKTVAV